MHIHSSFEAEQKRGQVIINGVVADFIRRSTKYKLLTAVDLYEISNFELFKSIIGIVSTNKFFNGKSLSYVGTMETIKQEAMDVMNLLLRVSYLDTTIGDCFDLFSTALNYLKPILTLDTDQVFYMHPSVLISLIENQLEKILDNNEDRANVLRFLDLMGNEKNTNIFNSDEAHYLKNRGYFPKRIIYALKPTIEQIHLSRMLKKSWAPSIINEKEEPKVVKPLQTRSSKSDMNTRSIIAILTPDQADFLNRIKERRKKVKNAEKDSQ